MVTIETEDGRISLGVAEGFVPKLAISIQDKTGSVKNETRMNAQQIEMFFSGLYVLRANVFRTSPRNTKRPQ